MGQSSSHPNAVEDYKESHTRLRSLYSTFRRYERLETALHNGEQIAQDVTLLPCWSKAALFFPYLLQKASPGLFDWLFFAYCDPWDNINPWMRATACEIYRTEAKASRARQRVQQARRACATALSSATFPSGRLPWEVAEQIAAAAWCIDSGSDEHWVKCLPVVARPGECEATVLAEFRLRRVRERLALSDALH